MATPQGSAELVEYLHLKLAALGQPFPKNSSDARFLQLARPLLRNHYEKERLLGDYLCPADTRIQSFLDSHLSDCPDGPPRLPASTFILDRAGLARAMSLPPDAHSFSSPYLRSYRVPQGVLHNPASDRRTTRGVFHIAEGGLPVPADKHAVPKQVFAALLAAALRPPRDVLTLPFTAAQAEPARLFVSLLIRPLVCPATGTDPAKTMETRVFAPGSLVSNLDFVEGIFGNAGDPHLPENDAALDVAHWTGYTGCVILAPHLVGIKKSALGLPHINDATERQRRDGMCWTDPGEPYNAGAAFKICARDHRGVIVTILADNYYGYCKKEVKTQISYAANLFGLAEEEHAGGAIAFATYVLGQEFHADRTVSLKKANFDQAMDLLAELVNRKPEGYAIDGRYPDVFYVPEDSVFTLRDGFVRWQHAGQTQQLTLRPSAAYILPSGFRVRIEKQLSGSAWRLIGSRPRGTLCHKPCTVSGGGKSEISKSIAHALLKGPVYVRDYRSDMDKIAEILRRDFSAIYRSRPPDARSRRPILSSERTLGSVIQLFTASPEYTDEHNEWVRQLPQTTRQLLFTVKRYYRPEWGDNWREHFTVDRINGFLGHELKFDNEPLVANYLRVGYDRDGAWRIYKLRPDFYPADKVQVEDDITASVVLPRASLNDLDREYKNESVKLVANCETLLFQRPDDAIHPGVDRQAEADIASPGTFLSNYEPLTTDQVRALVDHVVEFDRYTAPMKSLLENFSSRESANNGEDGGAVAVASSHPRLVNGKPSQNPRYLQKRPDLADPRPGYLAEIAARLERDIPATRAVHFPVNSVLAGRRNSPPDAGLGLPPLAVYAPIHYQELPELFMEYISSLTGKSPATTGFGSEGALTKGPFNALWPVVDLNNALVSAILTCDTGFTTSAGYIGAHFRVDHDVSMLVPEIWCRMRVAERDPRFLIEGGYLEKVEDFTFEGRRVLAGRLGYRITVAFADRFLGRIFETPDSVFPPEMLRPELQDLGMFAAGVDAIVESQRRVAASYFEDGSVEAACPPLRALLEIMVHGSYRAMGTEHPEIRGMFTREALLASDWYAERLRTKQQRDIALWQRHVRALEDFRASERELTSPRREKLASHAAEEIGFLGGRSLPAGQVGFSSDIKDAFTSRASAPEADDLDLEGRLGFACAQLARVSSPAYLDELVGTIGADASTRRFHR
jgi:phosphoenolpyruvate carboxykinase (diphosphate)